MQFVRAGQSDRDHLRSGGVDARPRKTIEAPDLGELPVLSRFIHGEPERMQPRSAVGYTPPGVIPGESDLLRDRVHTLLSEGSLADPK